MQAVHADQQNVFDPVTAQSSFPARAGNEPPSRVRLSAIVVTLFFTKILLFAMSDPGNANLAASLNAPYYSDENDGWLERECPR